MTDEQSRPTINRLKALTPARIGVGRCGTRPPTRALISFWADHAEARDAVKSNLSNHFVQTFCGQYGATEVRSMAQNREEFILLPPRGKRVDEKTIEMLKSTLVSYSDMPHQDIQQDAAMRQDADVQQVDIQIVVSDGLSALAVEENVPDLYPMLVAGFEGLGLRLSKPVIVHYGRVAVADQIGHAVGAKVAINLIGERPGLSCARGLSAYITYNPNPKTTISSDRTVVSNIHSGGTPAVEAGAFIVKVVERILQKQVSGVKLQALS
jgi:ethanolamine ammonia-lyase small subunit